jgi:homoserine/homoserine lactone efflux protein
MKLYPLFLVVAIVTVFSPGPGVVMTLTNSLRYGFRDAFGGILGISFGALIVAGISATSVGFILATSALAFTMLKFAGAAYLFYLGVRLWRAPSFTLAEQAARPAGFRRRFAEGLSVQLTNPKLIFFYLSVFPQFIDPQNNYAAQFALLVSTYSTLVVIIHCLYALFAQRIRTWLTSPYGGRIFNRTGAAAFMFFGAALACAKR